MTPHQKELARHALGLTNNRQSYRNHFVAGPGHSDYSDWMVMVARDLAKRNGGSPLTGGDDVFWLTREGATAALNKGERLREEDFPPLAEPVQ